MTALAAIAIFPVLTLLLLALTKAESMLGSLVDDAVETPLRLVQEVVGNALNDAPTGDVLPVPHPEPRLVEASDHLAA